MSPEAVLTWICVTVFAATSVITLLALIGMVRLGRTAAAHDRYLKRLFAAIIVQVAAISIGAYIKQLGKHNSLSNGSMPDAEVTAQTPGGGNQGSNPDKTNMARQNVSPASVQSRTRVVVQSEPRGATVSFDGKSLGVTPLTVEISDLSNVSYKLDLSGYEPAVASTTVRANETVTVLVPLVPNNETAWRIEVKSLLGTERFFNNGVRDSALGDVYYLVFDEGGVNFSYARKLSDTHNFWGKIVGLDAKRKSVRILFDEQQHPGEPVSKSNYIAEYELIEFARSVRYLGGNAPEIFDCTTLKAIEL